jgi:DNA-binding NarL/FixJ family response regulator
MVKSLDITGRGCMLFFPTAKRTRVSDAMETRWRQVMAHANAGLRVRAALQGDDRSPVDTTEAVLEVDGRAVHATGQAESREARQVLREAVREMDHSRGAMRRSDPDAALAAWKGLVTGRWSLVDHFESDGRRYILARRNDPQVTDPRALTLQERQIARYAAQGLASKHVAYTLGVSEARVSQALNAALRKLGLRSRAELVRVLFGGEAGAQSEAGES